MGVHTCKAYLGRFHWRPVEFDSPASDLTLVSGLLAVEAGSTVSSMLARIWEELCCYLLLRSMTDKLGHLQWASHVATSETLARSAESQLPHNEDNTWYRRWVLLERVVIVLFLLFIFCGRPRHLPQMAPLFKANTSIRSQDAGPAKLTDLGGVCMDVLRPSCLVGHGPVRFLAEQEVHRTRVGQGLES